MTIRRPQPFTFRHPHCSKFPRRWGPSSLACLNAGGSEGAKSREVRKASGDLFGLNTPLQSDTLS